MTIDWKKVAKERARELRQIKGANEFLRLQMQQELHRRLSMHLHARCISRAGELADEISTAVSKELVV